MQFFAVWFLFVSQGFRFFFRRLPSSEADARARMKRITVRRRLGKVRIAIARHRSLQFYESYAVFPFSVLAEAETFHPLVSAKHVVNCRT